MNRKRWILETLGAPSLAQPGSPRTDLGPWGGQLHREKGGRRHCRYIIFGAALTLALSALTLTAQEPGNVPEANAPTTAQAAPAPQAPLTPDQVQAQRANNPYWIEHNKKLMTDFGDLAHYAAANASLPAPAPGEQRVVFMGDSITQGWNLNDSFPGKPYVNRGISGQTTPQMLVRFRQDVVELHPAAVILLGGTNDLAGNTGPMTLEQTENNLSSMADIAAANHIRVILCSVTPSVDFPWYPGLQPAPKIAALNQWIKDYAAQKGYIYVDYYSALVDTRGGLPSNLSHDGVHPNPAAHAIMAPLAQAGIDKALAK
jgi:lysophospholipase L1-like esterase